MPAPARDSGHKKSVVGAFEQVLQTGGNRIEHARHLLGLRPLWYGWNAGDPVATAAAWPDFRAKMPAIAVLARAWARALARQTDLAEGLVRFCENRL